MTTSLAGLLLEIVGFPPELGGTTTTMHTAPPGAVRRRRSSWCIDRWQLGPKVEAGLSTVPWMVIPRKIPGLVQCGGFTGGSVLGEESGYPADPGRVAQLIHGRIIQGQLMEEIHCFPLEDGAFYLCLSRSFLGLHSCQVVAGDGL